MSAGCENDEERERERTSEERVMEIRKAVETVSRVSFGDMELDITI